MTLKFSEKVHRYWCDGRPIPGVTGIIGKGVPKPAIPYWAARCVAEFVADEPEKVEALRGLGRDPMVAALKGVPWTKRDEAAVRGTAVHALAERVIHGEAVEVPEHLAGYVEGYVRFLDDFDVEPVLTEKSVANREHWYAGRFDSIVHIPTLGDRNIMVDLKTSTGVYGETSLQNAAYSAAEFYVNDGAPEVEIPMPLIEGIAVAHVTEYGTYLYDLGDRDVAHAEFLAAKRIADSADRRKNLIGDPIEPPQESAA